MRRALLPILAAAPLLGASADFPWARESVGYEFGVSAVHRVESEILGSSYGSSRLDVYSALKPIDVFQMEPRNLRMGILSPILTGGALLIFTAADWSASRLVDKYWNLLLLPGYLLNPRVRFAPAGPVKLYSGYGFNVVHEDRFRPIFSFDAGATVDVQGLPRLGIGYDRIFYRGKDFDGVSLSMAFEVE